MAVGHAGRVRRPGALVPGRRRVRRRGELDLVSICSLSGVTRKRTRLTSDSSARPDADGRRRGGSASTSRSPSRAPSSPGRRPRLLPLASVPSMRKSFRTYWFSLKTPLRDGRSATQRGADVGDPDARSAPARTVGSLNVFMITRMLLKGARHWPSEATMLGSKRVTSETTAPPKPGSARTARRSEFDSMIVGVVAVDAVLDHGCRSPSVAAGWAAIQSRMVVPRSRTCGCRRMSICAGHRGARLGAREDLPEVVLASRTRGRRACSSWACWGRDGRVLAVDVAVHVMPREVDVVRVVELVARAIDGDREARRWRPGQVGQELAHGLVVRRRAGRIEGAAPDGHA